MPSPANTRPLNTRQQQFVEEFLKDLNATQAAIRAGYTEKAAGQTGFELLKHPEIARRISAASAQKLKAADLDGRRIILELGRIATFDMRKFYDDEGNLKPVKDWDADMGAVVSNFEVIKKNAQAGDGIIDTVHKIKLVDKAKALDTLAKHFGLLIEKMEHSGEIVLRHEMPEE